MTGVDDIVGLLEHDNGTVGSAVTSDRDRHQRRCRSPRGRGLRRGIFDNGAAEDDELSPPPITIGVGFGKRICVYVATEEEKRVADSRG